jgi:Family of unknown function (DUF5309)
MPNQRFVRDDGAVKESVLDLVTNISPTENYFLSNLQRASANDEFHLVPRDTLRTPTLVAAVEGADASYDGNDPTTLLNMMHIIQVGFAVTDSEAATDRYGSPEDRVAYETEKALKDWSNFAELALVRSTIITGNNSTARQMRGLKSSLSIVTSQSGVSLSETILNSYLANVWAQGANVDMVAVPMTLKRRISGFNGNGATKFYNQDDKRLVTPIEIYESDASNKPIKLVAHRYVTVSGDTNNDIVGVEMEHFATAWLREPKVRPLAKTGDAENRQVIGEFTLEARNQYAGFHGIAHL